jgi:small subunit ribosomal protein S19
MARSVKKGPFVQDSLMTKVQVLNSKNEKRVVKTMVGHKLGEFAPTRLFRGHSGKIVADKKAKPE